jgi:hypothetical protein
MQLKQFTYDQLIMSFKYEKIINIFLIIYLDKTSYLLSVIKFYYIHILIKYLYHSNFHNMKSFSYIDCFHRTFRKVSLYVIFMVLGFCHINKQLTAIYLSNSFVYNLINVYFNNPSSRLLRSTLFYQ